MSEEAQVPHEPRSAARPRIIGALAALWLGSAILYAVLALRVYANVGEVPPGLLILTGLSALMAAGLWTARRWALPLQIAICIPALVMFPVCLASLLLIGYLTQPETRNWFAAVAEGPSWHEPKSWFHSEWAWALSLVAVLALSLWLLILLAPLFRAWG